MCARYGFGTQTFIGGEGEEGRFVVHEKPGNGGHEARFCGSGAQRRCVQTGCVEESPEHLRISGDVAERGYSQRFGFLGICRISLFVGYHLPIRKF